MSFFLKSCRPMESIGTPSITIRPPVDSSIRNSDNVIDDLPAPVRPTMPTCNMCNEHNSDIIREDLKMVNKYPHKCNQVLHFSMGCATVS